MLNKLSTETTLAYVQAGNFLSSLCMLYLVIYFIDRCLSWNFAATQQVDISSVGFEVLIAVVINSSIFWHITACSPLKVNRRFGGKYLLHLQGRWMSQAKKQSESKWQAEPRHVPPKRRLTFNGLQSITSQKVEHYEIASVYRNIKVNYHAKKPQLVSVLNPPSQPSSKICFNINLSSEIKSLTWPLYSNILCFS
jgi:hypothetical protein